MTEQQVEWVVAGLCACAVATPLVASAIMRRLGRRKLRKRRAAMDAEWKKIEKHMAHGATAAEVLNHQLRGGH